MQTKPNEWLVRNAVSVLEVVDAPQLEGAGELEVGLPVRARRVLQHDQGRAARAGVRPGLRDPVLLQLQQGSSRAPFYKTPFNGAPLYKAPFNGAPLCKTPFNGAPLYKRPFNALKKKLK